MDERTRAEPSRKEPAKARPLNVLLIEDVEDDAQMLVRHLEQANGFTVRCEQVETAAGLQAALEKQEWDVVLCDHKLNGFDSLAALRIVKEHGLDSPVIVVSGTIGEEKAAVLMRAGAHDLILKGNLARLVPAIKRELRDAEAHRIKDRTDRQLDIEQRLLNNLMASLPLSIYFKDLQHRYIRLNEWEARVLNAESAESVVGKTAEDFVAPERARMRLEEEQRILTTGEPVIDRMEEIPQEDGTVRLFAATKAPIRGPEGEIIGLVGITRDITTRTRAERNLIEKSEQLEVVLESMDQGIYAVDADLTCTLINRRYAEMHELPPELSRPGTRFEDMVRFNSRKGRYGPGDVEEHVKHRSALARKNQRKRYEFDLRNGRIVELRSNPLPDGGFVRTSTDITEVKKKEEALRNSEERFRAILESLPTGVSLKDRNGRYLVVNKTLASWFGAKSEDIVGRKVSDFFTEKEASEIGPVDREVFASGEIRVLETKRVFPDGSIRHIMVHRCPVRSATGEVIAICTIDTDFTGIRKAEEDIRKLSSVVEQSPAGVIVTDTQGTIEYVNDAFTAITGYTLEEMIGQNPRMLKSDKTPASVFTNLWKTIIAGKTWSGTLHNRRKNGAVYLAGTTIFPLTADDGRITHFIDTQQDITQRVAESGLLKQAEKMESLGSLAGGIAHDFNNMLLPILALTKLTLRKLPDDNEHREKLEKVVQAATRAKELVSQILAFSRQEGSEQKNVDVVGIFKESLGLLRTTLPSTIKLKENMNLSAGQIYADAAQIGTVLLNLASNAADAMAGKPGKLEFSLSRHVIGFEHLEGFESAAPGPYARIEVMDSGHGMDEATLKRIFDPFFTTKDVGKGTGLGLATAYGIITKHRGMIYVDSKIDIGTTFDIYLPLVEEHAKQ